MRIGVNTRLLIKGKMEGVGWFTLELLKVMVKEHPEDEFLFFFDRPYEESFVFAPNITPIVLQPPARHPYLFYLWFEFSVARALKKYKADVFLSPDNFCSLRTTIPTVLVIHDLAYLHFPAQIRNRDLKYYRRFMPQFAKRANIIISVSKFTKADLIQQYQIPASKIEVACNGCKPTFKPITASQRAIVKQKFSNGQNYFFYIGAVHPRKNVHRLITAFDHFKQQTQADLKLLIAGNFSWKTSPVQTAYEQATAKSDIHFLGYISEEVLPQLMASAFALVYVSLFEGFGVPLLEAMKAEVPIITSNRAAMPEVVGDAALLVNPENTTAIAHAMQKLWSDQNLREKLVEAGKAQRQQYSWEKAATVTYAALQKTPH